MKAEPIVIERTFDVGIEKVWKAITDKKEMKQWYFDLAEFRTEVGFEFKFNGIDKDGKTKVHLCKVTEVIPHKKLTYSWRYEGLEGISYLTFELSEASGKNKIKADTSWA